MVGYSGTPLAKKLGIKEGMAISILNSDFEVPDLPKDVTVHRSLTKAEVYVIFATRAAEAASDFTAT